MQTIVENKRKLDVTVDGRGRRIVRDTLDDFDLEHYIREKTLRILRRNGGVKLTTKTLTKLAHTGLRLIPPLGPWTPKDQKSSPSQESSHFFLRK